MKDRDRNILTGVVIVGLAIQTCQAQAPTVEAPPQQGTGTSEALPSQEVDQSCTAELNWAINQDALDSVANTLHISNTDVSGYTINIEAKTDGLPDRKIDIEVVYALSPNPINPSQGLITTFIFNEGDVKQPQPLLIREAFENNGEVWMREKMWVLAEDESAVERTVFEYPADANARLASGKGFGMLYYPTSDVALQLFRPAGELTLPILVNVPPLTNYQVAEAPTDVPALGIPTPFSNVELASYTIPETVSTLTPAEVEKAKQTEVLRMMDLNNPQWEELGYLKEFTKNGGVLTERTIEFNGQQVEAVGFRIGMTEIWVAKDLVNRQLDYYGGAKKQVGEVIVPNENVEDWQYKIAVLGAYIHASNMGYGENVLGCLQSLQENPDSNYVMQDFRVGANGLIHIGELPPVNPNVPVRMFIGNPTLTKAQVEEGKIYGGNPKAPYDLPYYITGGHAGVIIGNDGGMTIAFTNVLTSGGLLNVDYNENAARIINIIPKVGALQSLRSPNSSYGGPGSSNPFIYIEKDILGPDYHTPLFNWKIKE